MAEVTEVRESGIEIVDGDIEGMSEDVDETVLARLPSATDLTVDESLGNDIQVRGVEFIGVASINGTQTVEPMQAAMMGLNEESDEVVSVDEETGEMEVEVDEAALFIANEDGETGIGLTQATDAGVEDVLSDFEEEHL